LLWLRDAAAIAVAVENGQVVWTDWCLQPGVQGEGQSDCPWLCETVVAIGTTANSLEEMTRRGMAVRARCG